MFLLKDANVESIYVQLNIAGVGRTLYRSRTDHILTDVQHPVHVPQQQYELRVRVIYRVCDHACPALHAIMHVPRFVSTLYDTRYA